MALDVRKTRWLFHDSTGNIDRLSLSLSLIHDIYTLVIVHKTDIAIFSYLLPSKREVWLASSPAPSDPLSFNTVQTLLLCQNSSKDPGKYTVDKIAHYLQLLSHFFVE